MDFTYKNTSVYFSCKGKGSAVVLLHGFLENSTMWSKIVEVLQKKHKVICVDLLGHGKTGNLGYIHTMDEQANMVKAILNHLKLRKYIIVGHSMGGYIALSIAKLYPKNIKGLCLMNSTFLPDSKVKKQHRNRAILAVKQNYKTFIKVSIPMLFSEENALKLKKEMNGIIKEALKMTPQGIVAALEGMKIREDYSFILEKKQFPILMILGKQDPVLDYNTLKNQTKNKPIQVVNFSGGHMSHVENIQDLICTLLTFIKNCKKT